MIQTKIKEAIKKYSNELTDIRRKLHSEPELSWQEEKTTEFICQYLEQLGIAYRRTAPTGVIATIEGKKSGKTVALRGDMDALSVEELNKELSYVSKEEEKCMHVVMMLIQPCSLSQQKYFKK